MAPSCLLLASAACAVAAVAQEVPAELKLAATADEGPAVRIVNHVLLEAVVLLLIAVVALCALLVFLGRLLCCFRTGRQGLLDPLLIDDEPLLIDDEDLEDAERHTNPDTSRSSSAQTARLSASHGPRRCFQDLHVPTRIPIMRRILEARGRLSKKTEVPSEHRDKASGGSPKLLGRERLGSPPSRKVRGSEVRKPSAAAKNSSVRQPAKASAPCKEPAEKQADPATPGPMLYQKLFSQAAETEDLREVVYCNLAHPSTSLFSSPATTPRARLPSDADNVTPPRSSPGSSLTVSTMENEDCEKARPSLSRDATRRIAWSESWLSQATRKQLPAAKTIKWAWSDLATRRESTASCLD